MRIAWALLAAVLSTFALRALAQEPPHTIAPSDLRSGKEFVSPETRGQQDDRTINPGMLWVEQGDKLWRTPAGPEAKSCASCHDAPSALKGAAARYPSTTPG